MLLDLFFFFFLHLHSCFQNSSSAIYITTSFGLHHYTAGTPDAFVWYETSVFDLDRPQSEAIFVDTISQPTHPTYLMPLLCIVHLFSQQNTSLLVDPILRETLSSFLCPLLKFGRKTRWRVCHSPKSTNRSLSPFRRRVRLLPAWWRIPMWE